MVLCLSANNIMAGMLARPANEKQYVSAMGLPELGHVKPEFVRLQTPGVERVGLALNIRR
jgi:hypothetical protein